MAAAVPLAFLLAASGARASDGVLEINQACVAAGCFAGDAPGLPVEITTAGSYQLTSDIVVPGAATSGIVITSDDTSLNLGGFAVRGPVTCTGAPVTSCTASSGGTGILTGKRDRIFGGAVRGFAAAGIGTGADTRLWDLIITSNGGSGVLLATGASVRDSQIVGNFGDGISTTPGGLVEVSGCTVRENGQRGVDASGGLVLQSRFDTNGLEGLRSATGGADAGYALSIFRNNNAGGPQIAGGRSIGCNVVGGTSVCGP